MSPHAMRAAVASTARIDHSPEPGMHPRAANAAPRAGGASSTADVARAALARLAGAGTHPDQHRRGDNRRTTSAAASCNDRQPPQATWSRFGPASSFRIRRSSKTACKFNRAPTAIRTRDRRLRRPLLYPSELWVLLEAFAYPSRAGLGSRVRVLAGPRSAGPRPVQGPRRPGKDVIFGGGVPGSAPASPWRRRSRARAAPRAFCNQTAISLLRRRA